MLTVVCCCIFNRVVTVFSVWSSTHLPFADKLDDGLWAGAHHILPAQHHRRHETVFLGHKALLQVKRLLVPSQYFGPNLESLSEGQRAPVADGGGPYHHFGTQFARGHEQTVSHIVVETGKVTLPQVAGVVHVAHVVQIVGEDHAVDALLG